MWPVPAQRRHMKKPMNVSVCSSSLLASLKQAHYKGWQIWEGPHVQSVVRQVAWFKRCYPHHREIQSIHQSKGTSLVQGSSHYLFVPQPRTISVGLLGSFINQAQSVKIEGHELVCPPGCPSRSKPTSMRASTAALLLGLLGEYILMRTSGLRFSIATRV